MEIADGKMLYIAPKEINVKHLFLLESTDISWLLLHIFEKSQFHLAELSPGFRKKKEKEIKDIEKSEKCIAFSKQIIQIFMCMPTTVVTIQLRRKKMYSVVFSCCSQARLTLRKALGQGSMLMRM